MLPCLLFYLNTFCSFVTLSSLLCYSVFLTLLPCLPYSVFLKHWAVFSVFCQFIYLADNVRVNALYTKI